MMFPCKLVSFLALFLSSASAFSSSQQQQNTIRQKSTALNEGGSNPWSLGNDFLQWDRAQRSAGSDDNVVSLRRPLGLILNQDDDGNVFVEQIAPNGNAARSGQVKVGDMVTMVSATFGDDMWSTRGVGLTRVTAAIRVRSGSKVNMVFESKGQAQRKIQRTERNLSEMNDARAAAQAKKDALLNELENDEKKLKKNFFGLF